MKSLLNKGKENLSEVHQENGGGLYGLAAVATWLWIWIPLAWADLISSWSESTGIVDFILREFIFDFGFDAAINAFVSSLYAAFWPIYWIWYFFGDGVK